MSTAPTNVIGPKAVAPPPDSPPSGVTPMLRIVISLLFAMFIGIIALVWNARIIPNPGNIPMWVGNLVFIPVIAVLVSFGTNCLIQYLSCKVVTIGAQAGRLYYVPILFYLMAFLLYMFPGLLWPIEGLVQHISSDMRRGLSVGFYTFWMALYTQAFMNGLAQICPK
jgi:hypothetical protein